MTSPALLIMLTKITLIADIVAIVIFIADYSRLVPWWRNPVGRTIVIKDILLLGVISTVVLSVFFQFSRFTSQVAAWIQIAELGAMAAVMLWRTIVFERIDRHGPPKDDAEPGAQDGDGG